MRELHNDWQPHSGQVPIISAVFQHRIPFIFIRCGRKFGKTEVCLYLCWRWALTYPRQSVYFLGPEYKQIKEIIWANQRVQSFGPSKYIKDISIQDTRISLTNGSFIKIDGSNNYEAYRGISPHFVVLDEFAQHDPAFVEVMWPNLAAHKAPIVIIGTPPGEPEDAEGNDHQYVQYQKDAELRMYKDGSAFYVHAPTSTNPHISREWLDQEKERLCSRGEEWLWRREYEAEYVRGGEHLIFPMFDPDKHVHPHEELLGEVKKSVDKLSYFLIADPGTTTAFAVLFVAYSKYTNTVYVLDEIYETETAKTSVQTIFRGIRDRILKITGPQSAGQWIKLYDPAAAWFPVEMGQFMRGWSKAKKRAGDRQDAISLMKDMLMHRSVVKVSDKCRSFIYEVSYYKSNERGEIQDGNDHLIDCFRYFLKWVNYRFKREKPPKEGDLVDARRMYTLDEEVEQHFRRRNWAGSILGRY